MSLRAVLTDLRVRYSETDQMGIVYHAHYLVWFEIGRTEWCRAAGLPYADMERDGIFITTKVRENNLTPDLFQKSLDESLAKLQLPYVDLLLIHWNNTINHQDTTTSVSVRHSGLRLRFFELPRSALVFSEVTLSHRNSPT